MAQDQDIRDRLIERLAALRARVDHIEADMGQPLDDDSVEQAVEREDDQADDAIEGIALMEIAAIEAAMRRLDSGSYGLCVSCGNAVEAGRLAVIPEAAQCARCAGVRAR